jgi:hypothetical protein
MDKVANYKIWGHSRAIEWGRLPIFVSQPLVPTPLMGKIEASKKQRALNFQSSLLLFFNLTWRGRRGSNPRPLA